MIQKDQLVNSPRSDCKLSFADLVIDDKFLKVMYWNKGIYL